LIDNYFCVNGGFLVIVEQMRRKILHSFYAGLGGHTAVFFASLKYSEGFFDTFVAMYGIEDPLVSTKNQLKDNNIPFLFEKKRGKFDFFHAVRYAWAIRKKQADVVFLHGGYGILYVFLFCVLFGKSKIVIRETQALNLKTRRQRFNSVLSLFLATRVVFLSEDYRNQFFNSSLKRNFLHKAKIIPNGLDLEMFQPAPLEAKTEIINIGMFSRIVPIKDYRTLINAFAKIIEKEYFQTRLVIAGDGSDLPNIIQYTKDMNVDKYCIFKGLLNRDQLVDYLQTLDVYVHSSLGETMSNSIMQAQACGLPIVATDVFGINNVVTNKVNGFLFDLGDVEGLVSHLEAFINSSDMRSEFGDRSRVYAEEHLSDELMGRRYNKVFKEMVSL